MDDGITTVRGGSEQTRPQPGEALIRGGVADGVEPRLESGPRGVSFASRLT